MNRLLITPIAKIVSIDSQPIKSNSSFGNWRVDYSINWNFSDKNRIGTMAFFWTKQEAIDWIEETKKTFPPIHQSILDGSTHEGENCQECIKLSL